MASNTGRTGRLISINSATPTINYDPFLGRQTGATSLLHDKRPSTAAGATAEIDASSSPEPGAAPASPSTSSTTPPAATAAHRPHHAPIPLLTNPLRRLQHLLESQWTSYANARRVGEFRDNRIRTALYTVASFLPQQVVQQFSKVGNFYFLCVSALQQIPGVSPTGQWTTLFPLAAFVAVAMAREAWEDYKRHVSDSAENGLVCERRRRRRTTWKRDAAGNNAASAAAAAKGTAATTGTTKGNAVGIAPSAVGKGIEAGAGGDDDWETVTWKDLEVGDVVRLHSDDFVPADLLLLDSSHSLGWCYIEASNLDGESDLKLKQPLPQCVEAMRQPNAVSSFSAEIYAESPNNNIYEFEGTLDLQSGSKRGKYSLSVAQLLPRGTTVACTETVVGAVVYTGEETKIRKNATTVVARKTSTVERLTNRVILTIMAVVVVMACVSTVFNYLWTFARDVNATPTAAAATAEVAVGSDWSGSASGWGRRPNPWYLGREKYNPARVFCAFVILYNNMIPISLYVALEIVRVFLSLFVDSDLRMFHAATGARAVARNNNIHEDLGRVRHFFTDKTGTLTENSMVFKKMSIAGQTYTTGGEGPGGDGGGGGVGGGVGGAWDSGPLPGVGVASDDGPEPVYCEVLKRELQHSGPDALAPQRRLLLAMALCHTVSVEDPRAAAASSKSSHASATGTLQRTRPAVQDDAVTQYQAASPDELALVRGARELGYVLRRRTMVAVGVTVPGDPGGGGGEMAFQCLCTLPFSSQRRRMSVIYRYPDGRYVLLCKGADAVILERLKAARSPEDETILDSTREHLSEFAIEGLRTLLYAWRVLEPSYFLDWMERYNKASVGETRAEALDALATEIERDLELLGATAIEDRLQQGVPETIEKLRRAGMKLWMLTGDKRETAMNIAYTCQLAHLDSDMIMVDGATVSQLDECIDAAIQRCQRRRRESKAAPWPTKEPDASATAAAATNREPAAPKELPPMPHVNSFGSGILASTPNVSNRVAQIVRDTMEQQARRRSVAVPGSGVGLGLGGGGGGGPGGKPAPPSAYHAVVVVDGDALTKLQEQHQLCVLDREEAAQQQQAERKQRRSSLKPKSAVPNRQSVLEKLVYLGMLCDGVICSRFSPSQKALIITTMRGLTDGSSATSDAEVRAYMVSPSRWDTSFSAVVRAAASAFLETVKGKIPISNVTLAIGDGANDIPMLQAAHVGIGIAGREGLAASRTSDYSIGQFRFVQDLLFVHGRYAYVRISAFTLGTFYKCVVLHIVQFLFQIWTGWSSTSLFEQWTLALYNVTFTSLPIIVVGIFEKDLNRSTLLGAPELYSFGIRGLGFNFPIFGKWMFHAAWHAVVCTMVTFLLFNCMWMNGQPSLGKRMPLPSQAYSSPTGILSAFTSDGTGPSMASALQVLGTLVFSTVVLTVNLKVSYVGAHNWTLYSHVAFWLSELAWFGFMLVYPRVWPKLPIGDEAAGSGQAYKEAWLPTLLLHLLTVVTGLVCLDVWYNARFEGFDLFAKLKALEQEASLVSRRVTEQTTRTHTTTTATSTTGASTRASFVGDHERVFRRLVGLAAKAVRRIVGATDASEFSQLQVNVQWWQHWEHINKVRPDVITSDVGLGSSSAGVLTRASSRRSLGSTVSRVSRSSRGGAGGGGGGADGGAASEYPSMARSEASGWAAGPRDLPNPSNPTLASPTASSLASVTGETTNRASITAIQRGVRVVTEESDAARPVPGAGTAGPSTGLRGFGGLPTARVTIRAPGVPGVVGSSNGPGADDLLSVKVPGLLKSRSGDPNPERHLMAAAAASAASAASASASASAASNNSASGGVAGAAAHVVDVANSGGVASDSSGSMGDAPSTTTAGLKQAQPQQPQGRASILVDRTMATAAAAAAAAGNGSGGNGSNNSNSHYSSGSNNIGGSSGGNNGGSSSSSSSPDEANAPKRVSIFLD